MLTVCWADFRAYLNKIRLGSSKVCCFFVRTQSKVFYANKTKRKVEITSRKNYCGNDLSAHTHMLSLLLIKGIEIQKYLH